MPIEFYSTPESSLETGNWANHYLQRGVQVSATVVAIAACAVATSVDLAAGNSGMHRKRPRRAWLPRGNRFEAKSLNPDWPIVFAFAWIFCRAALSGIASPSVGSGVGDVRSPHI